MKTKMGHLSLLIISCLLFNTATAIYWQSLSVECSSKPSKYRLPVTVAVCRHYDIKLIPSITSNNFSYYGQGSYIIDIYQITRNISLHVSWQLELNSEATMLTRHLDNLIYIPVQYYYCEQSEILTIEFDTDIIPTQYTLDLKFDGPLTTPNKRGFTRITYQDDKDVARKFLATNFLWNAREVFPCWDEPNLRATFNISVYHQPAYMVLSNMPIREQLYDNNMIWTHFHTTPPIPPYLVGIVIFDGLTSISKDGSVKLWGRPEAISKLQHAYEVVQLSLIWSNNRTKLLKMDHIAMPPLMRLNKYNWGLCNYEEHQLAYNPKSAQIEQKSYIDVQIVNTLSRHLLHSIISPTWWNYVWLNNGFAEFYGLNFMNKFLGYEHIIDYFVVELQHQALSKDVRSAMSPVIREVNTPEEIESFLLDGPQNKATAIMRMMYHIVSHDVFVKCLNKYITEQQFKSSTPDDLWEIFEAHVDQQIPSLKKVMTNWLFSSDYPIIQVNRVDKIDKIIVTQRHLDKITADKNDADKLWWVPINFATTSYPHFDETLPMFWLTPQTSSVNYMFNFPSTDWIIVNLQQTGYYRVNYDTDNWYKLANYLDSDEHKHIHPINRAQIIDDSYHLMLEDLLDSTIFLQISKYLKRERHAIPWYPMKKIFSDMSTFFQFTISAPIKDYMAKILDSVLEDVGFEDQNNDTNLRKNLRLVVTQLACQLGLTSCLNAAYTKLSVFLENPEKTEIPLPWRNWILCTGMMTANEYEWIRMQNLYFITQDIRYLEYTTCVENPYTITRYIEILIQSKENGIFVKELMGSEDRIIYSIIKKHAAKDQVLNYILNNFYKIAPNRDPTLLQIVIESIYRKDQFVKVEEFIKNHTPSMMQMNEDLPWLLDEDRSRYLMSVIERQLDKIQQEIYTFVRMFKL